MEGNNRWGQTTGDYTGTVTLSCFFIDLSQPTITCSKLTIETLEQGPKYDQS